MSIFALILILAFGLIVVIIGGNYLVDVSGKVCKITKLSEILVGATLTSLATTMPEIIISVLASFQNYGNIIIGDGLGTIIVNNCLILGLSLSFSGLKRISKQNINKVVMMMFSCIVLAIFVILDILNIYTGFVLLAIYAMFILVSAKEIESQLKFKLNKQENKEEINKKEIVLLIIKFIVALLFIFAGAQFIVNATESLALKLNIDAHIIAATIISVGTSIPELVTCIISIRKKRINLALGNIIGANTIVLTFLFGLCSIISGAKGLNVTKNAVFSSVPIMLMSILIVGAPIITKKRTYKFQGYALLLLYLVSLILILLIF